MMHHIHRDVDGQVVDAENKISRFYIANKPITPTGQNQWSHIFEEKDSAIVFASVQNDLKVVSI